jgi:hypothetical protein
MTGHPLRNNIKKILKSNNLVGKDAPSLSQCRVSESTDVKEITFSKLYGIKNRYLRSNFSSN